MMSPTYHLRLTIFVLFAFSQSLFSQKELLHEDAIAMVKNAERIALNKNNSISFIQLNANAKITDSEAKQWLLKTVFKTNAAHDLRLIKTEQDALGFIHYKYKQFYNGLEVEKGMFVVHAKDGYVKTANGEFYADIHLSNRTSILSYNQAEAKARVLFQGSVPKNVKAEDTKLRIIRAKNQYFTCYKLVLSSTMPLKKSEIFVNSENGEIILELDKIHTGDVSGTATTAYTGTRNIKSNQVSTNSYTLTESVRNLATMNCNNYTNTSSAVNFTNTTPNWSATSVYNKAAFDAHLGAEQTYDYYYQTFGRNSFDNFGAQILSYVHYDYNLDNAFWDGTGIFYGDGDGSTRNPFTSTDIVGHEFTHAVTEYSANLDYYDESGALNESFSDIFGVCVDFYANPTTANFQNGELISLSGSPLRDMSNPNLTSDPDTYMGTYWIPAGGTDNGGVHTNSQVQNFWFYLLCNGGSGTNDNGNAYTVSGIGMADASKIAYRTLNYYLGSTSQYADARTYSIQAAADLFGQCSNQVQQCVKAWYAVGVGTLSNPYGTTAGFTADKTYSCSVPATIVFTNNSSNATTYQWNFGDGIGTSTATNPSYAYTAPGTYNVKLVATGTGTCSKDSVTKSSYITISNAGSPISACTPLQGSSSSSYGISNVKLNTINNTTGSASEGYKDYTCTQQTNLIAGERYRISVATQSYENVKVWIDYDNNGVFDNTTELVMSSLSNYTHTATFRTSPTAVLNTPLRMRVYDEYSSYTISSACGTHYYGQTEDYTIRFSANSLPPVAKFMGSPLTVNLGGAVTFTDTSANVPTAWQWQFPGAVTTSSTIQNPTIQYNTVGTFPVKLIASNAFGSDSIEKTTYVTVVNSKNMCSPSSDSTIANSGILYDSGGPSGYYLNSQNCTFLIAPPCANTISLTLDSLYTESGYDYVRIYDGRTTTSTLLASYSGTLTTHPTVTSSGKYLLVSFYSDGSSTYPGFKLSWTSSISGTTKPAANFAISNVTPPIRTAVSFTDQTTNSPKLWSWDFGDGSTSTLQNPTHIYSSPGLKTIRLIAKNCTQDDTIIKTLTVQDEPNMYINPDTINVSLNCGDTLTVPVTIQNTGTGTLIYNTTPNTGNTDSVKVLVCTWGADTTANGEYQNTIASIRQYFTKFKLSVYQGNTATGLQAAITGQDVVLFPEHENNTYSHYTTYSTILQNFVSVGGIVIFCGESYTSPGRMFQTGLFSGSLGSDAYGSTIYINNTSDSITKGVLSSFTAPNAAYTASITNIDKTTLGTYSTYDAVSYRNIGTGKAIFLSSDFYVIEPNFSKMIANAVKLGQKTSISSSFNLVPYTDTILPGQTQTASILVSALGKNAGNYSTIINVSSNDTTPNPYPIVVNYQVIGAANINLNKTCISLDTVFTNQFKTDSFSITNSGCDTLRITSITKSRSQYTLNPTSLIIAPGQTKNVNVAFSSSTTGIFIDTIVINCNAGIRKICLFTKVVAAPSLSLSRDTIRVSLKACGETKTEKVMMTNNGGYPLIYTVNGDSSYKTNILIFATLTDTFSSTYTNVKLALTQYLTSYNLTKYTGSNATQLQSALAGKDVLLIPSQYNYTTGGFTIYQSVIQNFISAGGTVVICNTGYSTSNTGINDFGFFNTSIMNYALSSSVNVVNTSHLITNNLSSNPFTPADYITYGTFTGTNLTKLCTYTGYDVVSAKDIGTGHAIFIGYTYYTYDANFSKILSNAIKYSNKIPSWIQPSTYRDTIQQGTSDSLNLTFSSSGLTSGTYAYPLIINTNDPLHLKDSIVCILTVDNTPCGNFGDTIQNNCSGTVNFFDSTFNAPTSWMWTFGDNTTSTSKNPVHTYTATGTYTVTLNVCNGTKCDTVVKSVTISNIGAPISASCNPITYYSYTTYGIFNVTLNTINKTSAGGIEGYKDYTCSEKTELTVGNTYQLSVSTGTYYTQYLSAAIDFNNDGVFTTSEYLYNNIPNYGTNLFSYTVPSTVLLNTNLRMRIITDYYSISSFCYNPNYGQAEDYTIRFIPNNQPPVASFSINSINSCQGIVSFLDNSSNNATTWQWNFGDGTTSNVQNPTHKYSTAGTYTVVLIASNQYGSNFYSYNVTVSPLEFSIQVSGTPVVNQSLNFSSSLSSASTYNWDFGDGYAAGVANPNHAYSTSGIYIVSLTCVANGCVNTVYDTITIDPVGIGQINDNGFIAVSPNPFMESTHLSIKMIENAPLIIDLYSASGQKVYAVYDNAKCTKGEYNFELSNLASGTYFVQIRIGEKRYYKKIVAIQH